jgi:hypothetical protein
MHPGESMALHAETCHRITGSPSEDVRLLREQARPPLRLALRKVGGFR